MQSVQERLRSVRKMLKMNQTDFGKRIGLSQGGYGAVETGIRKLTERTIMQICQEFNINEKWLRTGTGKIFIQDNDEPLLSQIIKKGELSPRHIAVIESFLALTDEQRDAIVDAIEATAYNIKIASSSEKQPIDWKKQELDEYAQELAAQEKGPSAVVTGCVTEKKA